MSQASLPVIDISPLLQRTDPALRQQVAKQIGEACRMQGFFYITGHGIALELQAALQVAAETFFALSQPEKMRIEMQQGGRAWRGYFPVGGELTSGQPVYSIDLWINGEADIRARLYHAALHNDILLIEGVMGLYDGQPSAADIARCFGLPVLAVISARAMAGTFGAIAYGLQHYQTQSHGALPWAVKDFVTEPVMQLSCDYYELPTNPAARPRRWPPRRPWRSDRDWGSGRPWWRRGGSPRRRAAAC